MLIKLSLFRKIGRNSFLKIILQNHVYSWESSWEDIQQYSVELSTEVIA
jgi:hypothetical protein